MTTNNQQQQQQSTMKQHNNNNNNNQCNNTTTTTTTTKTTMKQQQPDIYTDHCNGTRYLVKEIGEYRLILHKLDAKEDDKTKILVLPWIPCHYGGRNFPFELTQLQFPLKIFWH